MTQTAPANNDLWWALAECRDLPKEWFGHPSDAFEEPDGAEEPWEVDPRAKQACDLCPVRVECYGFAIARPELRGTWGGTSWHVRRQARRARERLACPDCRATTTVVLGSVQFCAGCGLSWRT